MKLCPKCQGKGCEHCGYEGIAMEMTFIRKNVNTNKKLSYDEYQKKKQREFKLDKKNARDEL